jgi:hypothetical protein
VAAQLGAAGRFILGPANDAFVSAMHVTTIVAAAIALTGAIVVLRWMPGRGTATETIQVVPAEPGAHEPVVPVPAAAEPVASGRAALRPAAMEAAEAPRIDPLEALDVWQENLTAGARGASEASGARGASRVPAESMPDPTDEYLVDVWPGEFADQSAGEFADRSSGEFADRSPGVEG